MFRHFQPFQLFPAISRHLQQIAAIYSHFKPFPAISSHSSNFQPFPTIYSHHSIIPSSHHPIISSSYHPIVPSSNYSKIPSFDSLPSPREQGWKIRTSLISNLDYKRQTFGQTDYIRGGPASQPQSTLSC